MEQNKNFQRDAHNKNKKKHGKNNTQFNSNQNNNQLNFQRTKDKNEQIAQIVLEKPVCEICNQPILDLATSLANKGSNNPVHFDCVLNILKKEEKLLPNENITYIGQGRFAVTVFENPHDTKKFSIKKIIEWEERDKKYEWRNNISNLFSQIK
jgi:hypothetical protein